jgi:hypothetical protein
MPLILGIVASGNYPRVTNSYESIATVTVGASAQSSISFTSIPSTYKHLQLRIVSRSNRATTWEGSWVYFNTDTTYSPGSGNYTRHIIDADGASVSASASTPTQGGTVPTNTPGTSTAANIFGVGIVDILDYADTNKFTTARLLTGFDANGSGALRFISGLWRQTAAVNAITLNTQGGGDFPQYSSFALYGIKG